MPRASRAWLQTICLEQLMSRHPHIAGREREYEIVYCAEALPLHSLMYQAIDISSKLYRRDFLCLVSCLFSASRRVKVDDHLEFKAALHALHMHLPCWTRDPQVVLVSDKQGSSDQSQLF